MNKKTTKYQPMVYIVRAIHMIIGIFYTIAIFYIWFSAIFNIITIWTWLAIMAHVIEGIVLLVNRGYCPMGIFHNRYGDDKTLFELVAGKTYAKYGMKIWLFFAITGTIFVILRFW